MSFSEAGEKRQQILRAAVKVFSQKGFHDAKVDEIAQLADVGKGTVYEYFSSKAQLFQEMCKVGMNLYVESINAELKPEMSSREKLERIAGLHVKFMDRYKDLARVTMAEHTHFDEDFRQWILAHRAERIAEIEQIIREGITAGEFRQIDPGTAALVFVGTLGAICSPVVFSKGRLDIEKLLEPAMEIIFHGLSNNA